MPVTFPDVVAFLTGHLATELAPTYPGIVVASQVPNPRPAQWVRVQRTGGTILNRVVDNPIVVIEAWDNAGDPQAMELAQAARSILHELSRQVTAAGHIGNMAEAAGPANLPDPGSRQPRATLTVLFPITGART